MNKFIEENFFIILKPGGFLFLCLKFHWKKKQQNKTRSQTLSHLSPDETGEPTLPCTSEYRQWMDKYLVRMHFNKPFHQQY